MSVAAPGSASVAAAGSASVAVPFFELGLPPLLADSVSVATPGSASITVPFAELGYPPLQVSSVHNSTTSSITDAPVILLCSSLVEVMQQMHPLILTMAYPRVHGQARRI